MNVLKLSLDKIRLDTRNPRIAHSIEGLDSARIDDEYIELALGRSSPTDEEQGTSTTYASLRESIRTNGGLIFPIIVKREADGTFLTIEGNTRVAIYRELRKADPQGPWQEIPAIVHEDMEEVDEHAVRLQSHLIGPRPWRAYAKGKYLHHLYHDKKMSLNDLVDFCGGKARMKEIEEYIQAYADMTEYFGEELQTGQGYSKFSAFVELQQREVKTELARQGFTLADFAKWVADGNIRPLNTVRYLPRILRNPASKKKFLEQNAQEAMKLLDQPNTSTLIKDAPLEQLASALALKLRTASWDTVRPLLEEPESSRAVALVDCYNELRALVTQMGIDPDGAG